MTRLLVLGALALTVLLWNCGGSEKPEVVQGQSEPAPVIPDSIKNRPKLPVELRSWRLLTYTKDGTEQRLAGADSVSILLDLKFDEAIGSFGCNDFRGPCVVDSTGTIRFGNNLTFSSRVCKGLMTQERYIKEMITEMKSYTLSADHRRLELSSDNAKMLYIARDAESDDRNAPKVKVTQ
ncbi:MAG: META domain-containing protein [Saprospiraceae bacterium]|nr:META domain-containing protein [Saprospiraceae bacterium]MDZ4702420.1 META domain-containing protein [Saprospiraceae bacterium]